MRSERHGMMQTHSPAGEGSFGMVLGELVTITASCRVRNAALQVYITWPLLELPRPSLTQARRIRFPALRIYLPHRR